jgi:hypothetical protein
MGRPRTAPVLPACLPLCLIIIHRIIPKVSQKLLSVGENSRYATHILAANVHVCAYFVLQAYPAEEHGEIVFQRGKYYCRG